MTDKTFYQVLSTIDQAPLRDYLLHGYETRRDFEDALRRLVRRWQGRTGECIDERHGFLHLRFHDTPGGKPDEAWLPHYILRQSSIAISTEQDELNVDTEELDRIYGFD